MKSAANSGKRGRPSQKSANRPTSVASKQRNKNSNTPNVFDGMHHRRDKRYPMMSGRPNLGQILSSPTPAEDEQSSDTLPAAPEKDLRWKEALMLWLSWNSTYEKLTSRMCRTGQDKAKIEVLMDEMDQLRRQAIDLSETLID